MKAHRHGGNTRVGLPGYEFDSDGLHGYAGPCFNSSKASCPTTFPAPPTLGNAWNLTAIEMMGDVISTEHRAWHNSEGQCINIFFKITSATGISKLEVMMRCAGRSVQMGRSAPAVSSPVDSKLLHLC